MKKFYFLFIGFTIFIFIGLKSFANVETISKTEGKEIIVINGSTVMSFTSDELIMITPEAEDFNRIMLIADTYPILPGGMRTFIDSMITYPEAAKANHTEGIVMVNFVVEKDGSISNVNILRGIGDGCDDEVLRVIRLIPKMKPATINNEPVRVALTLPVRFKLKY